MERKKNIKFLGILAVQQQWHRVRSTLSFEIPQLQENNNFGVEVDYQDHQINDTDDINNEILSEFSGRERVSEVRINLDSWYPPF